MDRTINRWVRSLCEIHYSYSYTCNWYSLQAYTRLSRIRRVGILRIDTPCGVLHTRRAEDLKGAWGRTAIVLGDDLKDEDVWNGVSIWTRTIMG